LRTKQKKIKFSKGEINPKLLERQDLTILDSSASYIKNMISTPFGSVKTRDGSTNLGKVEDYITAIAAPTITNSIGGTDASLYNVTALFQSDGIEAATEYFSYDFGAATNIYKLYIEDMYFSYTAAALTVTLTDGVITDVVISDGGIGLNGVTLTVVDGYGSDADLTATVDSAGTITAVTIVDGGTGYSGRTTITVNATKATDTVKLQTSPDAITWTDNDTYAVTTTSTDFVTTIDASHRYIRLLGTVGLATKLNLYSAIAYDENVTFTGSKLASFVFNLDQKYLLVLRDENIDVYLDDVFSSTFAAAGLLASYFDKLKITQAEDTMIFTHEDMVTKQLVRSLPLGALTWTWGNFPWTNLPMDAFGAEVTTQPAATLTPSAVSGSIKLTAGAAVFTAASIGQLIDGGTVGGGRLRITGYESTTIVYGYTIIPFYTTSAIASGSWDYISGYEVVWSATRGYPRTCMFYQQRLWFGGSKSKPNTLWSSRVGQYDTFENVSNYDNDGISATISSTQIDEIVNIYVNRGIQVFTAGAEWIVPEDATTPDTIYFVKSTPNGSLATVDPVDISGATLFIEKNGKSLMNFVYAESQAAYTSQSLSLLTDLIDDPVGMSVDYNSSQDVGNFLYIVMDSGVMAVFCIMLDQKIVSPVRHETDGNIKDIVNVAGDTYMLVDRKDRIFLEKISQVKSDCEVIDSGLSASISGLDLYNGYNVRVYNDDTNFGTYYVIDGDITLTSVPTAAVNIGLDFSYSLISNKLAINGQTGNIEKRIAKATVTTNDTPILTFEGQEIAQTDDLFDVYSVTAFERDCRFSVTGTFNYTEILSILLNINYGEK